MKKRLVRILVYFALAGLTMLLLSHPYIRQNMFGPKIKGEPLWAWQEEFRAQNRRDAGKSTTWDKVLNFLKLNSRPLQWIGSFPAHDPELLPVLKSLVHDADENIRAAVAISLVKVADKDQAVAILDCMLDDQSEIVQQSAIHSLGRFGQQSSSALPKMKKLMESIDPVLNPEARLQTAFAIFDIEEDDQDALRVIRENLNSPVPTLRRLAVSRLSLKFHNDELIFQQLLQYSSNQSDLLTRQRSVRALYIFGKKSVPHLERLLQDTNSELRRNAISALAQIGPEAISAAPALRKLGANTDDPFVRAHVDAALEEIQPKSAKRK